MAGRNGRESNGRPKLKGYGRYNIELQYLSHRIHPLFIDLDWDVQRLLETRSLSAISSLAARCQAIALSLTGRITDETLAFIHREVAELIAMTEDARPQRKGIGGFGRSFEERLRAERERVVRRDEAASKALGLAALMNELGNRAGLFASQQIWYDEEEDDPYKQFFGPGVTAEEPAEVAEDEEEGEESPTET